VRFSGETWNSAFEWTLEEEEEEEEEDESSGNVGMNAGRYQSRIRYSWK